MNHISIFITLLLFFQPVFAKKFKYAEFNTAAKRVGMEYINGKYCIPNGSCDGASLEKIPYNYWFQSGPHNTYEHYEPKLGLYGLKDYLTQVSSLIELDIHRYKETWQVYHQDKKNNLGSNCTASQDSKQVEKNFLSSCLDAIQKFHIENPKHHVITLWLELKHETIWENSSPTVLNKLIRHKLIDNEGKSFIFDQQQFLERHKNTTTLRDAATKGWPTLGELQGKIIIILFNHNEPNALLLEYETQVQNKAAFIAASMYGSHNGSGNVDEPTDFENEHKNRVIFYSLKGNSSAEHSYGLDIFRQNRVSSTFYVTPENTPGVSEFRDFFIQHGRWGKYKNEESHNQSYQYSGPLIDEYEDHAIDAVVYLKSNNDSSKCLTAEQQGLFLKQCNGVSNQSFAIIDVFVDYDKNGQYPKTKNNRAYIIQAVTGMNTEKPNEKIVEAKGRTFAINGTKFTVSQYEREGTNKTERLKDQYWLLEFPSENSNVVYIKNLLLNGYLNSTETESLIKSNDKFEWLLEKSGRSYE